MHVEGCTTHVEDHWAKLACCRSQFSAHSFGFSLCLDMSHMIIYAAEIHTAQRKTPRNTLHSSKQIKTRK